MKPILFFFATLLFTMNLALPSFAQTGPQSIYIDCDNPSGSQSNLKRPRGDGNVWVFQIVPGASVHWVEGPNWSYPGKGGADPSWGQWNGGDGSLSLSWISPDHTGAFNIGVTGKITCGSGGVTQPANTDAENPKEVGPGETVNLAVSAATDQDTWTQGTESDTESEPEWIELANVSDKPVDVKGWEIVDGQTLDIKISELSLVIPPKNYLVVKLDGTGELAMPFKGNQSVIHSVKGIFGNLLGDQGGRLLCIRF